jgi:hypothetical protein
MSEKEYLPAVPIKGISDLVAMGEMIAKSAMFGAKNDSQGMIIAATCHQEGISYLSFKRTFHLVDGTPSMRADAMAAEFRKRGGKYKVEERTKLRAAATFEFEGQVVPFEFTMKQAEEAGLTKCKDGIKTNWKNFPENMLWARMISNAVRVLCPEVCAGLYTPEEVSDFVPEPRQEKVIPTETAAKKASKPKPEPKPEPEPETIDTIATEIDYGVCQSPKFAGQRWENMDSELLAAALESERVPSESKEIIEGILNERALSPEAGRAE